MKNSFQYSIQGSGLPFFFQHGLGSERTQPQVLLNNLNGVQLISMDSMGHGTSPFTRPDDISFDRFSDNLVALADHLQIQNAVFGGISMVSGIALNIALRYPEYVRALILVRPAWLDVAFPENLKLSGLLADLIKRGNPEMLMESEEYKYWERKEPGSAESLKNHALSNLPNYAYHIIHNMWADRPIQDLKDLRRIQIPVLILASHQDFVHPFHYGEILFNHLPQAQLAEIPSRYVDTVGYERESRKYIEEFLSFLV